MVRAKFANYSAAIVAPDRRFAFLTETLSTWAHRGQSEPSAFCECVMITVIIHVYLLPPQSQVLRLIPSGQTLTSGAFRLERKLQQGGYREITSFEASHISHDRLEITA